MGRRGPKPEPAAVKAAKGNPSRRPIGADPVVGKDAPAVTAPRWLSKDGRAVWERLAPRTAKLNLLTVVDADTFGRYCEDFGEWLRYKRELRKSGAVYRIKTASGTVRRPDPRVMICFHLETKLMAYEANFGLNPAERQRIFAARAANGPGVPDLFNQPSAPEKKPASQPQASDAKPPPHGFLN